MSYRSNGELDKLLRSVQRRVLDEVHLGRRRIAAAAVCAVAIVLGSWWTPMVIHRFAVHGSGRIVGLVALSLLALACLMSLAAVIRQRFRLICAATFASGLATPALFGAYWSARVVTATGTDASHTALPLMLSGVSALMCATLLPAALSPVDVSHPDAVRQSPAVSPQR